MMSSTSAYITIIAYIITRENCYLLSATEFNLAAPI